MTTSMGTKMRRKSWMRFGMGNDFLTRDYRKDVEACRWFVYRLAMRKLFGLTLALVLGGCNLFHGQPAGTVAAPPVTAAPAQPVTPAGPNVFEQAGDATWKVVTAPARLIAPSKPAPSK